MPDLSQLETFSQVVQLGSLAAAARKQKISSAAISKQLTRLEEELGIQLLIRTTRTIALTDFGRHYFAQCQRILEEVQGAANLVSNVKEVPSGLLKVVSGRHFAASFIVPFIKEFLRKYPKIDLELELAERIPDINQEAIDVLIGMSISAAGDVIQRRILTTSYIYCASPAYLKKFGTPKTPQDLKKHKYITHSMRRPADELTFKHGQKVLLKPYICVNDAETMLKLALDGLGIVKLHEYVVREHLQSGDLKEVLAQYKEVDIPIYAAYPQRRFVPSKVRCFIDFILQKIR